MKKIIVFLLVACTLIACNKESDVDEILFVCTHGAARSPIAAAYFNKLAKENNLNFYAVFKGTEPNKELTKETIIGLEKDGFSIEDWKPEKVSSQDIEKAYKIVTFDCSVPPKKPSTLKEEWNNTPSISKDYNTARNVIKEKVEQLIENLKKE